MLCYEKPAYTVKIILTKKSSVYIYNMIVSVPLRNNVFYLYLAVPKETTHRTFGFNDNTIRNQKIFRPISGNTQKNGFGEIF